MSESGANSENLERPQEDQVSSESVSKDKVGKKTSSLAVASKISAITAAVAFGLFVVFSLWPSSTGFCLAFSAGIFSLFLSIVALLLGISALIAISLSKQLKGYGCASKAVILAVACWLLSPTLFWPWFNEARGEHGTRLFGGHRRLYRLGRLVIEYSKDHNGYLPVASEWCDLLMEYDKGLSRGEFKHPLLKHSACNFAFNKNLDGLLLSDIPGEVVLLFEADGDWNLAGTTELLKQRKDLDVYVFLVNGESYRYAFTDGGITKYDSDSKKVIVERLRWKP
jgi:hypothetical protein